MGMAICKPLGMAISPKHFIYKNRWLAEVSGSIGFKKCPLALVSVAQLVGVLLSPTLEGRRLDFQSGRAHT